jgi:muramoyltetrapeptide carboxypeptidase
MSKLEPLKAGDEIRVIAPSFSWVASRDRAYKRAIKRLEQKGYKVTLGKHLRSAGRLGTAEASKRLEDLHDAYENKKVKAILSLTGGWSANELLPGIKWEVISNNPKPLIGFSDITVLHNAIYAKTGQISLLGPNLGTLSRWRNWEYSCNNLEKILKRIQPLGLYKSDAWSPTLKKSSKTRSWKVLQPGVASGILIGGNLGTYYLLQGTEYAPQFKKDVVLLIEDDDEAGKLTAREFDRRLESLLQQPGLKEAVRGVLIGRFQPSSHVTLPDIKDIMSRKVSANIPVIADMDFGHTAPVITFPIGGKVSIDTTNKRKLIQLVEY